jgi:hypothetical protein
MSIVVKQPQSNTWILVLIVIAIAAVCQRRPHLVLTQDPGVTQQSSVSRAQEEQKANLEAAVSGAIGIDKARGDSVSVILR